MCLCVRPVRATQKGVAEDCSYGLYAAESAGFPQEVVDDARRIRVVLAANKDTVSRCVLTNFHAHRGHHPSTLNPILVAGNEKQLVACMQTLKVSFSARLCTQARAQRHVLAPVQNNLEPEAYLAFPQLYAGRGEPQGILVRTQSALLLVQPTWSVWKH